MKGRDLETSGPSLFVQIKQHFLFKLILSISNGQRIIMTIEAMNKSLEKRTKKTVKGKEAWKTHKQAHTHT